MSTMIEKVARAITEVQIRTANELFKLTNPRRVRTEERIMASVESGWRLNEKEARAAIEAMMEPTSDVEISVDLHCNFKPWEGDGKRAWQAGVQAALKEEARK